MKLKKTIFLLLSIFCSSLLVSFIGKLLRESKFLGYNNIEYTYSRTAYFINYLEFFLIISLPFFVVECVYIMTGRVSNLKLNLLQKTIYTFFLITAPLLLIIVFTFGITVDIEVV